MGFKAMESYWLLTKLCIELNVYASIILTPQLYADLVSISSFQFRQQHLFLMKSSQPFTTKLLHKLPIYQPFTWCTCPRSVVHFSTWIQTQHCVTALESMPHTGGRSHRTSFSSCVALGTEERKKQGG